MKLTLKIKWHNNAQTKQMQTHTNKRDYFSFSKDDTKLKQNAMKLGFLQSNTTQNETKTKHTRTIQANTMQQYHFHLNIH